MAHEVESMMYVGSTPWHGLGVAVPDGKKLSIEEAIVAAELDWEVELRHIFTEDDEGSSHGILNHYASCRKTDNTVLGIVGRNYKPLRTGMPSDGSSLFLRAGRRRLRQQAV